MIRKDQFTALLQSPRRNVRVFFIIALPNRGVHGSGTEAGQYLDSRNPVAVTVKRTAMRRGSVGQQ
jgi:hypothetical protein